MSKQVNFSNSGEIDPTKVKEAVFSQVDFPLDVAVFDHIETAFRHVWNVELGIRGEFYEDDVVRAVYEKLFASKVLISLEDTSQVVKLMLRYIENSGGYLEDQDLSREDSMETQKKSSLKDRMQSSAQLPTIIKKKNEKPKGSDKK